MFVCNSNLTMFYLLNLAALAVSDFIAHPCGISPFVCMGDVQVPVSPNPNPWSDKKTAPKIHAFIYMKSPIKAQKLNNVMSLLTNHLCLKKRVNYIHETANISKNFQSSIISFK